MKKFKRVFYIPYLVYFALAGFVAVYYEELVLYWDWDSLDTWVGLLKFVLKMGGLGLILFIVEIIIENIHIGVLNHKMKGLQQEVQDLKAKLYDQAQPPPVPESISPQPDSESTQTTEHSEDIAKEE